MHMAQQQNPASLQQQKQQQLLQLQQQQQHQQQLAQSQPPPPWNEEQTLAALRKLDELRSQVTELRSSIPNLISPFLRIEEMANPQELYDEFQKQVKQSTANVASFKQNFTSAQYSELFKRATLLRMANPKGIVRISTKDRIVFKSPNASEPENDKSKKDASESIKNEHAEPVDGEKDSGAEADEGEPDSKDPETTLAEFKRDHEDIRVEENFLTNEYKFTLPPPAHLSITVRLPGPQQSSPPQIVSVTPAKWHPNDKIPPLFISLERALKKRPNRASFSSLLQQIVTYKWLYETKCDICKRLTAAKTADMPVLRIGNFSGKRKRVDDEEEGSKTGATSVNGVNGDSRKAMKTEDGWCAFHESCLAEATRRDSTKNS